MSFWTTWACNPGDPCPSSNTCLMVLILEISISPCRQCNMWLFEWLRSLILTGGNSYGPCPVESRVMLLLAEPWAAADLTRHAPRCTFPPGLRNKWVTFCFHPNIFFMPLLLLETKFWQKLAMLLHFSHCVLDFCCMHFLETCFLEAVTLHSALSQNLNTQYRWANLDWTKKTEENKNYLAPILTDLYSIPFPTLSRKRLFSFTTCSFSKQTNKQ